MRQFIKTELITLGRFIDRRGSIGISHQYHVESRMNKRLEPHDIKYYCSLLLFITTTYALTIAPNKCLTSKNDPGKI